MQRSSWGSKLGFIFAAAGSAVGLANIWRLPYIVGSNGGAAFLVVYLLSLMIIGFPVFISEILIGRTTNRSPSGAFKKLGNGAAWGWVGKMTILTGFIVSSFYAVVAGWILGYLVEALRGNLTAFSTGSEVTAHYESLIVNPYWCLSFYALFLVICLSVLYLGVRRGIERGNKIMMPALFIVLILLVIRGVTLPGAIKGLEFLFSPDFSELTPMAFMTALGQAFFTLSLGQGTMVTYGSYLNRKENVITSCIPIVLMDTVVSVLAAVAVFTIVFSGGLEPNAGPGLLFHTLPLVFSQTAGGYLMAVMFFLLVLLAAMTSQISAMEPTIAHLMDRYGFTRHRATALCGIGVFLLGIPSALSSSVLDSVSFLASSILIPLGGFLAVVLVGWKWGVPSALKELTKGAEETFKRNSWLKTYFWFCFKYAAPILIGVVFMNALGMFG